jgi:hypothetical protein
VLNGAALHEDLCRNVEIGLAPDCRSLRYEYCCIGDGVDRKVGLDARKMRKISTSAGNQSQILRSLAL